MSWEYSDDLDRYRTAHDLNAGPGRRWMVMWAPALRAYVAFYLGPEAVPWQSAATGPALAGRLRSVERELSPTGGGFWNCPAAGCSWGSVKPMSHPCPLPAV